MITLPNKATYQYPRGPEHRRILGSSIEAMLARLAELYGRPRMRDVPLDVSWLEVLIRDLYPEASLELFSKKTQYVVELPIETLDRAQVMIGGELPPWLSPPNGGLGACRVLTAPEIEALWGHTLTPN